MRQASKLSQISNTKHLVIINKTATGTNCSAEAFILFVSLQMKAEY